MTKREQATIYPPKGITRRAFGLASISCSTLAMTPALAKNTCGAADKIRFAFTDPSIAVTVAPYSSVPDALGFFSEECIDFIMQPVNGATAGIQAVATGNADVSLSGVPGFYPYMEKAPGNFKMIYFYNNIYQMAVPADSKIKKVADLRGKTIGVLNTTSSGSYYYARAIVENAGLSPDKDVKWLPTGLGSQAAEAYRSGRIEAFGLWDSVNAQIITGLLKKDVHTLPSELNDLPAGGGFVSSTTTIKEKRDLLTRYLRACYKGMIWARAHMKDTVELHWKKYPVSAPRDASKRRSELALQMSILKARLDLIYPEGTQIIGYATPNAVQTYADKLLHFGVLKSAIATSDLVDMDMTLAANKGLDDSAIIATEPIMR